MDLADDTLNTVEFRAFVALIVLSAGGLIGGVVGILKKKQNVLIMSGVMIYIAIILFLLLMQ